MTKQREIKLLRQVLAALVKDGPDGSYTGAWLRDQLPVIEVCIRDDETPETRALAWDEYRACGNAVRQTIIDEATAEAVRIRKDALKDADVIRQTIIDEATAEAVRIRKDALKELNAPIDALGRVISGAVRRRQDLQKLLDSAGYQPPRF